MARKITDGGSPISSLATCDVCGRVLPKGCADRHPLCENDPEEFRKIQKAERPRFEDQARRLGAFRATHLLRLYDKARTPQAVVNLIVQRLGDPDDDDATRAREMRLLLYSFHSLAPDHPLFESD